MASVIPVPGQNAVVTNGGTPVIAVPANPDGGVITNPATATEYLFVNPVTNAATTASGTTFGLAPGQSWQVIPGQTTPTSVNANTSGHAFSVVYW